MLLVACSLGLALVRVFHAIARKPMKARYLDEVFHEAVAGKCLSERRNRKFLNS